MEGVPQLFCGNDVYISDVVLSTGLIRHGLWGNTMQVRVQRRVVSSSIGAHIASYCSKRELISAFRDIATSTVCSISYALTCANVFGQLALQELCTKKDLVHQDISHNNILLLESDDRKPQDFHSGLLIDMEYAASQSLSPPLAPGSCTVCILFPCHFKFSFICLTGNCAIYGH